MLKMLWRTPQESGGLQIKKSFVDGFGIPLSCNEAMAIAFEITEAKKGCGGSRLYIQRLFGKLIVGGCHKIAVFVEKSGANLSSEFVARAKMGTRTPITKAKMVVAMVKGNLMRESVTSATGNAQETKFIMNRPNKFLLLNSRRSPFVPAPTLKCIRTIPLTPALVEK